MPVATTRLSSALSVFTLLKAPVSSTTSITFKNLSLRSPSNFTLAAAFATYSSTCPRISFSTNLATTPDYQTRRTIAGTSALSQNSLDMSQKPLASRLLSECIAEKLEKPSLDDRSYRVIQLSNKLEALLIHDPETDKASAALDNNAGGFSDDPDLPGMAHAVEHLLFMGTKKVYRARHDDLRMLC